ncbi:MAG: hypothetical protein IME97_06625 [Proteobacteria bacterium]|nr:hypothetical protein [Pseudomonadota bacterium]
MKNFIFYFLGLLVFVTATKTWGYTPEDCIMCHGEGSRESVLHISMEEYDASIHGSEIACQDCHTGITGADHETIKGSGAVDCTQCHEQENRHGLRSKSEHRPQCHSCHTRHYILEKENVLSSVHPKQFKKTCKRCHPVECGETDYLSWLPSIQIASHKKQDFSRAYDRDNCMGCHQGRAGHGEEEPLNEQDCYQCHLTPSGEAKLLGAIHPRADSEKQPAIFAAATIYQFVILVLLWGGFRFYILKLSGKHKKRGK